MLDLTKKNISNDNLINTEFENIDISLFKPDRKFDLVICVGVLAHVDSVSDLISKLNEITSENGRIILQFTANEKLLSRINLIRYKYFSRDQYKYDVNKVSSSKMDSLLNSAGLKIIKKISYSPVSPFFSFFNYQKKIQLLELSYKNHFLSYFGSESILLLSKS
jgi:cyclopropane fatty-acyl-phospholipid synthase-like methyltransferase